MWLKIRTRRTDDFIIVGFTPPKGSRDGFGALYLAQYVDGELVFSGSAGSGFTGKQLTELKRRLDELKRPTPPCTGPIPAEKGATWLEPQMVCEVEYTERTDDGLLRQPVFLRSATTSRRKRWSVRMTVPRATRPRMTGNRRCRPDRSFPSRSW